MVGRAPTECVSQRHCGCVYTEFTDLEWEHNELRRYGILPKEFRYDLRAVFGQTWRSSGPVPGAGCSDRAPSEYGTPAG